MSDSGGSVHGGYSGSPYRDCPPRTPPEDRRSSSALSHEKLTPAIDLIDQPADLSMKRDRRDLEEGIRTSSRTPTLLQHSGSRRSSGGGPSDWFGGGVSTLRFDSQQPMDIDPAEGVVLDLASKPASASASHLRGRRHLEEHRQQQLQDDGDIIVLSDEEATAAAAAATAAAAAAAAASNTSDGRGRGRQRKQKGPKVNGHHVNGYSTAASNDDEEDEKMPEIQMQELKELSVEEVRQREQLIRKLKENLRSEEMKLVLLKKLQLSHQMKENVVGVGGTGQHSATNKSSSGASALAAVAGAGGGPTGASNSRAPPSNSSAAPPPLVRNHHSAHLKQTLQNPSQQMIMPPLVRPHNAHGPPPLVLTPRMSSGSSSALPANVLLQQMRSAPNHLLGGRIPVTTPPNVVLGYPLSGQSQVQSSAVSTTSSQSLVSQSSSQADRGGSCDRSGSGAVVDNQTPAQRQAAAKLALRKQLEKTLLQIPPPKPPPPEMHFIPNPANTEFIYLVGLEAVVYFITDGDVPKEEDTAPKPFHCVQCGTDFTPVWKWENTKRGTVICEQCVTTNIKKALKAEHTNRLKTAFVKALQQEQEIEQRMSQVSSSPPMQSPGSGSDRNSRGNPLDSGSGSGSVSSALSSSSSIHQLTPKLSEQLRHSHSGGHGHHVSAAAAAAAVAAAAQVSNAAGLSAAHQQLLRLPQHQPLPAHMLAPLNPFLAQAYQYQVLGGSSGKNPVTSAEIQRQYLLDMIPPRSLPQGAMNWKT